MAFIAQLLNGHIHDDGFQALAAIEDALLGLTAPRCPALASFLQPELYSSREGPDTVDSRHIAAADVRAALQHEFFLGVHDHFSPLKSEVGRVGKACLRTCRSRCLPIN